MAATGFATFFAKFNGLTAFSDLQKGAFECIQTMKYGIPIRTSAEGGQTWQFRGIVNCTSVSFAGMGYYANSLMVDFGAGIVLTFSCYSGGIYYLEDKNITVNGITYQCVHTQAAILEFDLDKISRETKEYEFKAAPGRIVP